MASSMPDDAKRSFWRDGEPFVWATGGALTITLLTTAILLLVVMVNGLGSLWPRDLALATLKDGSKVLGVITQTQAMPDGHGRRLQFKIANRDLHGLDFRWVDESEIATLEYPENAVAVERLEYGQFFGYLKDLRLASPGDSPAGLMAALKSAQEALEPKRRDLDAANAALSKINARMEALRLRQLKLTYRGRSEGDPDMVAASQALAALREEFTRMASLQEAHSAALQRDVAVLMDCSGIEKEVPLADIVRAYEPNRMQVGAKVAFYASKVGELLTAEPRESNTEGGLFPAILGTVMLIFTMSIFSFPLGVVAAVYLREYARQGLMVRLVRIAVNNLAGIPSIVYGIFGLGFFIYGVGGSLDRLFFPERLPTPTFGTGGILWASLTLGLLTVPVVIVATEEALGTIPRSIREGSLSLGATKFQTLVRIILPMASPGIMTGFILSMARAAGEVAPLMITGVVKLAPALPIDGTFPYLHLDRKFMHLGFHIYDIGFQSPNVEAAKPMVFVTTLLLLTIVLVMSSLAIVLRNRMRRRYRVSTL